MPSCPRHSRCAGAAIRLDLSHLDTYSGSGYRQGTGSFWGVSRRRRRYSSCSSNARLLYFGTCRYLMSKRQRPRRPNTGNTPSLLGKDAASTKATSKTCEPARLTFPIVPLYPEMEVSEPTAQNKHLYLSTQVFGRAVRGYGAKSVALPPLWPITKYSMKVAQKST